MVQKYLGNERIGLVNKNRYGSLMEIVEYNHTGDILVKFEQNNLVITSYECFRRGTVRNPYDKSLCGVGYIGEGKYKPSDKYEKKTLAYKKWNGMIRRCYGDENHKQRPSYKGCTVAEEWCNFNTFAQWYDDNFYQIEGEIMHLDKDILIKGNKVYSPETCIFVPSNINSMFVKNSSLRGELPIGVSFHKRSKNFVGHCSDGKGNSINISGFDTPEEVFFAYKRLKEKLIKQIADEYKDKIPDKLYNAMYSYEVEITD